MRRTATLLVAALMTGCGGSGRPAPAPLPAAKTTAPASAAAQATPPAATATATTPSTVLPATTSSSPSPAPVATPPAGAPPTTDCRKLGISRQKLREGPCTNGRLQVYVANTNTTADLDELAVRLNGVGLQPANGDNVYANLSVTVTNKLHRAVAFDALGDETLLTLGKHQFAEDTDVENSAGAGVAKRKVAIDPGKSQTVNLVFTVPRSLGKRLASVGTLIVTQFSDAGRTTPRKRIAVLRTYR